jgi:hypothetical protein
MTNQERDDSKMPLREAIAWASSDPDFFDGLDHDVMRAFLATACDAIEEKMKRDGVPILTGQN